MSNAGIGSPYWYEWQIGLSECLKMLTDSNIESVTLQCPDFQALDDVVVKYNDLSVTSIQVKHTDVDDNCTYSFLSEVLQTLAAEWQKERSNHNFREIKLVTNKKWGSNKSSGKCSTKHFITKIYPLLKKDIDYRGGNNEETQAIEWFFNELDFLGKDIEHFINIFSFVQRPDSVEMENNIKKQINSLVGKIEPRLAKQLLDGLYSNLSVWVTSRRKKETITKEDIYAVLCKSDTNIPEYELLPQKPIFPSRERFANEFIEQVINSNQNIIFLKGLPGSGKTNFISYLSQCENSIVDFRYYTYLPVNQEYPSYSDDEGHYLSKTLWLSILSQLKEKFENLGILSEVEFPIIYQNLEVRDMRACALKFLPIYSKNIGRTCYFFIDGMDHAARSSSVSTSFLSNLPRPEDIGKGVKFVFVGQPTNDKYPNWLNKNEKIKYLNIPDLEVDDIQLLLTDSAIQTTNINLKELSQTILSIIGNKALNILFAVMEIKKLDKQCTYDDIEKVLKNRRLEGQIHKYYEWIIDSLKKDILFYKLEAIFAYASRKITLNEIQEMCLCTEDEAFMALSQLYPLIICDGDKYYVFHNDIRLYFKEEIKSSQKYGYVSKSIIKQIMEIKELEVFKYDIVYNLMLNGNEKRKIFELVNAEYIMNSIKHGISIEYLSKQFINIMELIRDEGYYDCLIDVNVMGLMLSQYASCIREFQKWPEYVKKKDLQYKKRSEIYILSIENNFQRIIEDTYDLYQGGIKNRANELFDRYLGNKNMVEVLELVSEQEYEAIELTEKLGYIFRMRNMSSINKECEKSDNYPRFVNGWLEASSDFCSKEDLKITFSFSAYNIGSLQKYVKELLENNKDIFRDLLDIFDNLITHETIPLSIAVDLCVFGLLNNYEVKRLIVFLKNHINKIKEEESSYSSDNILLFIKSWFCIYPLVEKKEMNKLYIELLDSCKIGSQGNEYKTALAIKDMTESIFDIFYFERKNISNEILWDFTNFTNRYGINSCIRCNTIKIIDFLREVMVKHNQINEYSEVSISICNHLMKLLDLDVVPHPNSKFNELFYELELKEDFVKLADYWCGRTGKVWTRDYLEAEEISQSIIKTLEKFEENIMANEIKERLNSRLISYTSHKEYSLLTLFEYFKYLPHNVNKLLTSGMRVLAISDYVYEVGDNRMEESINEEVFRVSFNLGYPYINALFELKNTPRNFVEWRRLLLSEQYKHIDLINTDKELLALYQLTNSWINYNIENKKEYGKTLLLKNYNNKVIKKIKDNDLKICLIENLEFDLNMLNKNVENKEHEQNDKHQSIEEMLKEKGYSKSFENTINMEINNRNSAILNLLTKIKDKIPDKDLPVFANNCIKNYIVKEKYSYAYSMGVDLFKKYSMYFNESSWNEILNSIINRLQEKDIIFTYLIGEDISYFTLYYLLQNEPERLYAAFQELCKTHEIMITANGKIDGYHYELEVDKNIDSLEKFVEFQLDSVNHK